MRRIVYTCLLLCLVLSSRAQTQSLYRVVDGDTIRYTYTPIEVDSSLFALEPRKGFLGRVVDYFGRSTQDRTFEKKIDITFAGGPSYSKTTKLGLGLLAAGLYRLDRTDSITPPSDLSIYANITTSGFYSVGVTGNTLFRQERRRVEYDVSFASAPRDTWGLGYSAGRYNPKTDIVEQRYRIHGRFLQRIIPHAYVGALLNFEHVNGRKFNDLSLSYIAGQKRSYTATGIGLLLDYDSRDFIPNPSRGVHVRLEGVWFPRGLGNCGESLQRLNVTANYYRQLWPSGLLAFDLDGEFNSEGTPWTMLARLGGNARMRGYYEGRYTDNNLLTAQVELRQRIWRRIGCVVWGGAGNIFSKSEPFAWRRTLPNYGLGLRWELKKRVNVRMDYGFGRDTSGFLLSINEAF